ncbi:MAG: UDP-N-acetylglucosamine--N-acetylmuramyl-(pentapeptide) pyrophosphoryl-undecaprenol N-acetylglucosamine transferase [Treponema sp.]|nr:UDP-N-acetylglucosamine--N-acetylmuramyl-(pentapeptide) pyrophosphoryl-undecaprenol N-acetylglucosamine transferase [Treponema sp.]
MKKNRDLVFFTGGGTAGHIYPGLAVAEQLREIAEKKGRHLIICWIGCSKGMDKKIVTSAVTASGKQTVDMFYGIPAGKLRRYFSLKNLSDLFRILAGYIAANHILRKNKPAVLFSKGGFVSVPPCLAAKKNGITVFTHECDFSLGLANRINLKSAKKMFVSYEETKKRLGESLQDKIVVTGNPVRPVFHSASALSGLSFLGVSVGHEKPLLLVLGGSSGAKQINNLVYDNISWLCEHFIVVHQTGLINTDEARTAEIAPAFKDSYKPYDFIYKEMPDVLACADVILSRAGANTLWEAAVLYKPMVLVPLCGSGTRGDQVDNAEFFKSKNAAEVLLGDEADSEHLRSALTPMLDKSKRQEYETALKSIIPETAPEKKIAELVYESICENEGGK